jgi:hypothetical protein
MPHDFFPRRAGVDLAAAERGLEAYLGQLTAQSTVEPEAYVPMALSEDQASDAFNRWLKSLSLVPGDLTTAATLNGVEAKYVPFWVVSSMTYSSYRGERGENYKETEDYTDATGQHRTREVTRVAWEPVAGEVNRHFEHLAICAAPNLTDEQVKLLKPTDASELTSCRSSDVSDVKVERYSVSPREGFGKARAKMEAKIKQLVEKDIGGNQRKVVKVETWHTNVTVKHVLIPA